ncbi:MAG TPA: GntR family transcriptional regulator [Candidatus Baltobacteraceae bacterium]|jgi:DNA-binding GntR family transcriptional regulator
MTSVLAERGFARAKFDGPEALYVQLAEDLASRINSGEYGPRRRLPGEFELVDRYGLSRVTVRQAMSVLERRGLVIRRRGVGTFVASPKVHQDLAEPLRGFYDGLIAKGLKPEFSLVDFRKVTPNAQIAAKLGTESAMLVMRLYKLDNAPFAVTNIHLHSITADVTREEISSMPIYRILERLGRKIARADLTIRAQAAGHGPGRLLEIAAGEPVLILDRTSYDESDSAVENTVCYLRSDAYEFGLSIGGNIPLSQTIRTSR